MRRGVLSWSTTQPPIGEGVDLHFGNKGKDTESKGSGKGPPAHADADAHADNPWPAAARHTSAPVNTAAHGPYRGGSSRQRRPPAHTDNPWPAADAHADNPWPAADAHADTPPDLDAETDVAAPPPPHAAQRRAMLPGTGTEPAGSSEGKGTEPKGGMGEGNEPKGKGTEPKGSGKGKSTEPKGISKGKPGCGECADLWAGCDPEEQEEEE